MGNKYRTTTSHPSGKVISDVYFGYDLNNLIVWQQRPCLDSAIFLDYNASGLLKASRQDLTQANGLTVKRAGTAFTLYEYDTRGNLIEKTDPLGNTTYNQYDRLGRLCKTTQSGLTTTFAYEDGGLLASTTTPRGATTSRFYTTNGLLQAEVYPDGTQTCLTYDFFGRPIQEIKNGVTTTIEYDDALRQEVRIKAGVEEIYRFDSHGNLLSFTDGEGYIRTKTYDSLNRIKTETAPSGDITTWNYQGDTVICTLPSGEQIIQRYEAGTLVDSQTIAHDGTLIAKTSCHVYQDQNILPRKSAETS